MEKSRTNAIKLIKFLFCTLILIFYYAKVFAQSSIFFLLICTIVNVFYSSENLGFIGIVP